MFSIIIPTYHRNEDLGRCLTALHPTIQQIDSKLYEVIVSDDSKINSAKEFIEKKFPWVIWIEGTQKGPAANRNNGAKQAKGDWLIFLDDDCEPEHNFINAYQSGVDENKEDQVFEGCTLVDRPQLRFDEEAPYNANGGYLFSCNFAIKRELFERLSGFDENFPYAAMEDTDFAYRLMKLKIDFRFLEKASVVHPWRLKEQPFKMSLNRFKSSLYFIRKHPERQNDLGFIYYLKAFLLGLKGTVEKSWKFRFKGIGIKLTHDFLQFYFALYMLFHHNSEIKN